MLSPMKRALVVALLAVLSAASTSSASSQPKVLYIHEARPAGTMTAVIANLDGSNAVDLSSAIGTADFAEWSPDGSRVALAVEGPEGLGIYVVRADGGDPRFLARLTGGVGTAPAWSPDGKLLAFIDGDLLWTVPADGSAAAAPLTAGAQFAKGTQFAPKLSWSPDGARLLADIFPGGDNSQATLVAVSYPGGAVTSLAVGDEAAWSPLGDLIAFRSLGHVAVMRPDGAALHDLTAASSGEPAWLNERAVAFTSYDRVRPLDGRDNAVRPNIYIAPADGSAAPARVTGAFDERDDRAADSHAPVPSPDGAQIEFQGIEDKPWRANADGTCPQRIPVPGSYYDEFADWGWQPGSAVARVSCTELWTLVSRIPVRVGVGRPAVLRVTVENHGNEQAVGVSLTATALTRNTKLACSRGCRLGTIAAGGSRTVSVAVSASRWQRVRARFSASHVADELRPELAPRLALDTAVVSFDAVPAKNG